MKLFQSIIMSFLLLSILAIFSFLLSKKTNLDINKTSPFECGFSNFNSSRLSFSIHFFMVAIIFLMFDIEVAIMLPIFISFKFMKVYQWMLTSLTITTIITYGLYHEWINGVIEWSK
uniref:NADH-ubiquinone oxidoreductase chain 3 n=1 Tax=Sogatella furcifera TaxID=113103 RepID=M9Q1L8_SOGFU|nr:NADH dehydrogenase subunit 3 [Sogatella furcifera]AGH29092.1 NADH dehydrogenase subunit 3 [Sogatella furcifera]AGH29109.1 NADH dehydrogenase subunit 3 [Sogatella furcifera]QVO59332.1 NADH dehydrogenase subunit 3 [Sogatella furcifera]UXN45378.1 NADH dehydrogenase subunit 3 [Sogatella furcifera]UXN45391.1 NADH dehydrogenase subunit 3 [Sogatella furcifera]